MGWVFEAEGRRISWDFIGDERKAVGALAAAKVLDVHMRVAPLTEKGRCAGVLAGSPYRMVQTIRVKGVGKEFTCSTMRRLQVFWPRLDPCKLLSAGGGKSFMSDANGCWLSEDANDVTPEPGVYVRGIYVQPPPIRDTLLCFGPSSGIEVSGRDRNTVAEENLRCGVFTVLSTTNDDKYRRQLLEPLRGNPPAGPTPGAKDEKAKDEKAKKETGEVVAAALKRSWLLRSPEWLNSLLTSHTDSFLSFLGIPDGAIFTSEATGVGTVAGAGGAHRQLTFIQTARSYLQERGAPVLEKYPGSNEILFKPASDQDVRLQCVHHLLREVREAVLLPGGRLLSSEQRKQAEPQKQLLLRLLSYCEVKGWEVHPHPTFRCTLAHRDLLGRDGQIIGGRRLGAHIFFLYR